MQKQKYIIKECKHHGSTDFVLEGRGYYRCKQCRQDGVTERRRKNKKELVNMFGGKCTICGYSKYVGALDFHHLDPTTKSFGLANRGLTKSMKVLTEEAQKCVLLCANCHREVEAGIISIPSGATAARTTVNR